MNMKNVYVDVHVIQTVPPSNINRDDTGSPKTAQYGGVTRARVSSQSWKKAVRNYFKKEIDSERFVGIRSLKIVEYIADKIQNMDASINREEALTLANTVLNNARVTTKDNKVKALFFISPIQAEKMAQAAIDGITQEKTLQAILNDNPSVDIALFGRMVADDPTLNEDASSQVAHAISTHAVHTEFDFYTATDDLAPEDNAGGGMLGTIEFNSSTLYRYANVAAHELKCQLSDDIDATVDALKLFIESFAMSMPTGKVNTFANQTLPQAIIVALRCDRPINLVTAFETPVKSSDGYVDGSVEKLKNEFKNVLKFVDKPAYTFTIGIDGIGEEQENFSVLIDKFAESVSVLLQ